MRFLLLQVHPNIASNSSFPLRTGNGLLQNTVERSEMPSPKAGIVKSAYSEWSCNRRITVLVGYIKHSSSLISRSISGSEVKSWAESFEKVMASESKYNSMLNQ